MTADEIKDIKNFIFLLKDNGKRKQMQDKKKILNFY